MKTCSICAVQKPQSEFYIRASRCKSCDKIYSRNRTRTKKGLLTAIYSSQKSTAKKRGNPPPNYSKEELFIWATKQGDFHALYLAWIASNYNRYLRPSCDRIDEYVSYTLANLRLVTWGENEDKGYSNRRNGINNKINSQVIQLNIDGSYVNTFYSQAQAARETGVPQPNIQKCCKGSRQTAGGYTWRYA